MQQLSYTSRQCDVRSTKRLHVLYVFIVSIRSENVRITLVWQFFGKFLHRFLPILILYWLHLSSAQAGLQLMLQSVKRRIFSSKNICVKVLATFRKMHNKMAQQRRFFANFKLQIFLVNQSYLDIPLAIQVKVSVIQKSILNCYITAHVARNRISLYGNRVKILKK